MTEGIRAIIMLEILGRPAEYIIESMESIIKRIGGEKGTRVITKKVHEAKAVEKANNLFTTFAEVEVETDSIDAFFRIVFTYNPSHIEIVFPEHVILENSSLNLIANEIVRKLHQYDEIAKVLSVENNILMNKLRQAGISMVSPTPVTATPADAVSKPARKTKAGARKIKPGGGKKGGKRK